MSILFFIAGMALFTIALYVLGQLVTLPARQRATSIERAASWGGQRSSEAQDAETFRERVIDPLRSSLAKLVLRFSPKTTAESVQLKLFAAGMRNVSPVGFLAAKAGFAIAGAVGGLLLGGLIGGLAASIFVAVIVGGVGYLAPDAIVGLKAKKRREAIRRDLSDSLDLLAVSVEAGLGFDAAIAKLTERSAGPLSEEFEFALREIQIGESRENALKKLAERTGSPEVGAFVRSMVQADQLGMSVGHILRVQATESRLKRHAAAEEKGMKAPIKMLFPTVLFIFPAMFIVILAPAFIALFDLF